MKWVYTFALLCFFLSCQKSNSKVTLSDEVLIAVIKDLHIAESATTTYPNAEQADIEKKFLSQICSIHNISEEELNSNLKALYTDKDHYAMVYDSVIAILNVAEKSFYKESGVGVDDDPEDDLEDAKADEAVKEMEDELKKKPIKNR